MAFAPRRELTPVIPLMKHQRLQMVTDRRLALCKERVGVRTLKVLDVHSLDGADPSCTGASETVDQDGLEWIALRRLGWRSGWAIHAQQVWKVVRERFDVDQVEQVDVAE